MKDNVMLVGLAEEAWNVNEDLRWAADNNAEMWTLNNFYAAPWLMPYQFDKAFQIHEDDLGDYWPINYNLAGVTAVILDSSNPKYMKALDKYQLIKKKDALKYGPLYMSSSFSYMMMLCRHIKKVRLTGIKMRFDGEYQYQIPGVLMWIELLREEGTIVECELEKEWVVGKNLIDWSKLKDVKYIYGDKRWSNPNGAIKVQVM